MEVRRQSRRGPAPGEMLVKESAAHLGPGSGAKESRKIPWSALLIGPMLAHGLCLGNLSRVTEPRTLTERRVVTNHSDRPAVY